MVHLFPILLCANHQRRLRSFHVLTYHAYVLPLLQKELPINRAFSLATIKYYDSINTCASGAVPGPVALAYLLPVRQILSMYYKD